MKFPPWWGSGYFLELHNLDFYSSNSVGLVVSEMVNFAPKQNAISVSGTPFLTLLSFLNPPL